MYLDKTGKDVEDRRRSEESSVRAYFSGSKRFYDARENANAVKIFSGEWYVSIGGDELLTTILGSCVAACIRDPVAKVGGMNHFLLPGEGLTPEMGRDAAEDAARYGVFAMELLINGLMNAGAMKHRFEVKVFGGGNVLNNSTARIGSKNAAFIRDFLKKEGMRIESEDLEGDYPRRVHYQPDTGKAMVRLLRRRDDLAVVEEEAKYSSKVTARVKEEADIELF